MAAVSDTNFATGNELRQVDQVHTYLLECTEISRTSLSPHRYSLSVPSKTLAPFRCLFFLANILARLYVADVRICFPPPCSLFLCGEWKQGRREGRKMPAEFVFPPSSFLLRFLTRGDLCHPPPPLYGPWPFLSQFLGGPSKCERNNAPPEIG